MPDIPRPTTDRLVEILRSNEEAGDILCGHAADEIERLRLTEPEREALHHVVGDVADITGPVEETLRALLERTQ